MDTFLQKKYFKNTLVKQAAIINPQTIIDVGSGTGTLTFMLHKQFPQAQITGIDGDENIIKIAN